LLNDLSLAPGPFNDGGDKFIFLPDYFSFILSALLFLFRCPKTLAGPATFQQWISRQASKPLIFQDFSAIISIIGKKYEWEG
jgi:hypothetical protein